MKLPLFFKFFISLGLLMLLAILSNCKSSLDTSGAESYGIDAYYIQPNSVLRIYSYKNDNPEFLTHLDASAEQTVSIPRNIIVPTLVFGSPVNELIYADRSVPGTPVPIDMFLKIYSPSSPSPDYYFEVPILGYFLTPTNVTTALSWILRWGFEGQDVSLSQNQFEDILTKVEVACEDCRAKTNTEMVDFILNDTFLRNEVYTAAKNSTASLTATSITYAPPSLDYAWSSTPVSSDWKIITSVNEPEVNPQTGKYTPSTIDIETLFISPEDSVTKVNPQSWSHKALLLDSINDGYINLEDVDKSRLTYSFGQNTAGLHDFGSQVKSTYANPPPLKVLATVTDTNALPQCLTDTIPNIRANMVFEASLDYTITPQITDVSGNQITRLTSSNVTYSGIDNFPDFSEGHIYAIEFYDNGSGQLILDVNKTAFGETTTVNVLSAQTYISGNPIEFDNMSLIISGGAQVGDLVEFKTPYPEAGQGTNENNIFYDSFGCHDPEAKDSTSSAIFRAVSTPDGLVLSRNGKMSWLPKTNDALKTHTLEFLFENNLGMSYPYSVEIQVTEDQLPRICLASEVDSQTGLCPENSSRQDWPLNGAYKETVSLNESIAVTDPDGDPLSIRVRNYKRHNTLSLVTDSRTNFNSFTRTQEVWDVNQQSPSHFEFLWEYTPHVKQVEGDLDIGRVATRFFISYDTSLNPRLNNADLTRQNVDILIENTINAPSKVVSSIADCGGSPCNTSNQHKYYPQHFILHPDNNNTGDSPYGVLTDPKTQQPILISNKKIYNSIKEGKLATIQIPVSALPQNDLYTGSTPIMYGLQSNETRCPFASYGHVKIEPSICQGENTTEPKCLTLYLNYNVDSLEQEPIPYNAPLYCDFRLSAHDTTYASASTDLGNHRIYIQDVNRSPYVLNNHPTSPEDTAWLPDDPETPEYAYPVEGKTFDLKPFLNQVFGDLDLGPFNGQDAIKVLAQAPTYATNGNGPYDLFKIKASKWQPRLYFRGPNKLSGIQGSFVLEDSADGQTWSDFSGTLFYRQNAAVQVIIEPSSDFSGLIRFKECDLDGTNCTNKGARRSDFSVTNNTSAAGAFTFYGRGVQKLLKIQIESITSGSVKAHALGTFHATGEANQAGQDILELPPVYDESTSPNRYLTLTAPELNNSRIAYNRRYIAKLNLSRPFVRARLTTTNSPPPEQELPTINVDAMASTDSKESTLDWECWIVDDQENYSHCSDPNSNSYDLDGNPYLNIPFPKNLPATPYAIWKPPFSIAADGNLLESTDREPSFDVVIRMIDKGYYPFELRSPSPMNTTCGAGDPSISCIDYRFPLSVIETPAAPTVTITKANDDPYAGAKWRPQNKNNIPLVPLLDVNEGDTLEFKVKVQAFSPHIADLYNFTMQQVTCTTQNESCTARTDGTGFMLEEPYPLGGDLSTVGGSQPLNFTFKLKPNYYEGNGPTLNSESLSYSYRYKVGPKNSSGELTTNEDQLTIFNFDVEVHNTNRPPTGIVFTNNPPNDSTGGYNCSTGDSVCNLSSDTNGLKVDIDKSTKPSTTSFSVPLSVLDPDLDSDGSPTDNLQVNLASANNNLSVVNTTINGQPQSFLRISLGSQCTPGTSTSTVRVQLRGSDSRPETTPIYEDIQISVHKVNSSACMQ